MNILFELLNIETEENSGVYLYSYNLIKQYAKAHPEDRLTILCLDYMEKYIRKQIDNKGVQFIAIGEHEWKYYTDNWLLRMKKQVKMVRLVRKYDVCVSPFANVSGFGMWPLAKQIGVIHDLQLQKLISQGITQQKRWIMGIKWRMRLWRFHRLVTISDKVKKDIKAYCGKNAIRIYNPCGYLASEEREVPGFDATTEYILDINTLRKYKNAGVLVKAFNDIKHDYPSLKLYIKGKDFDYQATLEELVKELGLGERVIIDAENRDSEEIAWLFNHAKIFVTPSLMEGFGLTPVEAAMAKVPVIASDIDTLREILGDCAVFFNPHSSTELASLLRQHLDNPLPESELTRRADCLSKKFSMQQHIDNYYRLFHHL